MKPLVMFNRDGKLLSSGVLPGSYNLVQGGLREGSANMPEDPSTIGAPGVRDITKTFENKEVSTYEISYIQP